ncbi:hypothetical protein [Cyanobium sp. LEGE 06143]|uniref:hypothetical protein n=1 Tax=Cyanobium sp. LEGE 06143 TaxID=945727 RepID=UPI00187E9112|nr:hypothetical protein [Cyanobium sp. LEGE 06143]
MVLRLSVRGHSESKNLRRGELATESKIIGLDKLATSLSTVTVLFIHYHHRGLISAGYLKVISSAIECGYRVVLVSTKLSDLWCEKLVSMSVAVIQRGNSGYDFGSLQAARKILMEHGLLGSKRYVVINSSMLNIASHGFHGDPFLDALVDPPDEADLVGITSSYEDRTFHIQTFFFSMSQRMFEAKTFGRFLGDYLRGLNSTKEASRTYAIKNGELKLTRFALSQGLLARSLLFHHGLPDVAAFEEMKVLSRKMVDLLEDEDGLVCANNIKSLINDFSSEWIPKAGLQYNPSQACWALLMSRGFLFLKREVLELSETRSIHAPSVCALLMPLLSLLTIDIPEWSDLNQLPEIIYAPPLRSSKR